MQIIRQSLTAVVMILVLTLITGIAYPLVMTALAQVIFPAQANGSLIRDGSGNVVGSTLIAQSFADRSTSTRVPRRRARTATTRRPRAGRTSGRPTRS
jgi:K+-transporting ATPase c subunit